jgi:hypothetical protein
VTLYAKWTNRRVDARSATWEPRLGRAALLERERALTAFVVGWLATLVLLGVLVVAVSRKAQALQIASILLLFGVSLPCMVYGSVLMFRTSRLVLRNWDLPDTAAWSLKARMLKDPKAFDDWLARQQAMRNDA